MDASVKAEKESTAIRTAVGTGLAICVPASACVRVGDEHRQAPRGRCRDSAEFWLRVSRSLFLNSKAKNG